LTADGIAAHRRAGYSSATIARVRGVAAGIAVVTSAVGAPAGAAGGPPADAGASAAPPRKRGQLALLLQELLTTVVRLRGRTTDVPADAEAFRGLVRRLIASANQEARQLGYGEEDVGYAVYAVVAFLDETILALGHASFAAWQGRPLQEEVFGASVGGDVFYQYMERQFARDDSDDTADVLEVFLLCLLLGFRGRYMGSEEGVHQWIARARERVARIRGAPPPFAPNWAPTGGETARPGDPWQRRLLLALGGTLGVVFLLWVIFWFILGGESGRIAAGAVT
jgi:type VI secretion system protein ImpK